MIILKRRLTRVGKKMSYTEYEPHNIKRYRLTMITTKKFYQVGSLLWVCLNLDCALPMKAYKIPKNLECVIPLSKKNLI